MHRSSPPPLSTPSATRIGPFGALVSLRTRRSQVRVLQGPPLLEIPNPKVQIPKSKSQIPKAQASMEPLWALDLGSWNLGFLLKGPVGYPPRCRGCAMRTALLAAAACVIAIGVAAGQASKSAPAGLPDWSGVWQMVGPTVF